MPVVIRGNILASKNSVYGGGAHHWGKDMRILSAT